jgi:glycosyltransferase involved in cell wall biosynthesis
VFETGRDTGSDRHFFFCKHAVRQGHCVNVITSNVDYKNARVKFSGRTAQRVQSIEGVTIHYVYSYASFRGSFIKRVYYYLTYFLSSLICGFKIDKPDVIYAVSTPLTVGLLGYIISRIRNVPFVFEVTDLWPEAAVACGVVKNKVLIRLADGLAMFCYKKAVHIVGLGRNLCENIVSKGIDRRKVSLITNGVDQLLFNIDSDDASNSHRSRLRNKYEFVERFVAMYMGAHGAYNSLNTIIDAATLLKDNPKFLFVLVGDGDEKHNLLKCVDAHHLTNVLFLPPMPRSESPGMLAAADAFVLPNRKGEFFNGNLPNKLFDFLASAKPVVIAGTGESAELVLAAGAGRCGPAEDSQFMAKALVELSQISVDERVAIGKRGRDYVFSHYNRSRLSDKFLDVLAGAVKHG